MKPRHSLLLYLAALFAGQEAVFRWVFPLPELGDFNRAHYAPLGVPSPERQATTVANATLVWASEPDQAEFAFRLNAYGFRDRLWTVRKDDNRKRFAFVGDSYVEGLMAGDEETIPAGFGHGAQAEALSIETMNLGAGGAGLENELQLILDTTPVFRPEEIFLILFANDLPAAPVGLRARALRRRNPFKPRVLDLLGMWRRREMLPLRWSSRRQSLMTAVPDPDNPWSNPQFERRMSRHVSSAVLQAMRRGTFNTDRIGGSGGLEDRLRMPIDVRLPLKALKQSLEACGTNLRVVYLPERGQVTGHYRQFERCFSIGLPDYDLTAEAYQRHARDLAANCRELGIPFLDLTPLLREEEARGNRLYWDYDDHMRGGGCLFVGQTLFEWWKSGAPETRESGSSDDF